MSNTLPPPPDRPGLGNTFKRPIDLLQIGNTGGPGLIIADTVPTELNNYYGSGLGIPLAQAYIGILNSNGDYFYIVAGVNAGTDVFAGAGVVIGGAVRELLRGESGPGLATPVKTSLSPNGGHVFLGSNSSGAWSALSNNGVLIVGEWLSFFAGTEINYGGASGVSLSRGPLLFVRITSNVAQLANVNEQFLFDTVSSYTFTNGRAYLVTVSGQVNSAAVQRVRFRVRKNTLAGTILISWPTINIDSASTDIPVYVQGIIVNTSGADVTTKLAVTTQGTAATLINYDGQAAPTQTFIRAEDIGDTNMYSGVSL